MQVLILTQEQCNFCEQAQALLSRLATQYPLEVTTLALHSPEGQALAMQNGILFAPGILLDGVPFSYGRPSERKLRRELERRFASQHSASSLGSTE